MLEKKYFLNNMGNDNFYNDNYECICNQKENRKIILEKMII
ncbi:hypothetical protein [Paraclostridium bifermentans]|jgi:hypothetical protein|nr:hypothetical protein [Paraclostridium bifermentans]